MTDSRDVDQIVKEKSRLVEFAEAYDYLSGGRAVHYLSYFKSISNIFDLEFFTNKLGSSAHTIANVEKMVLSGVPFWEEGDDALFGDMDEEEESEEEEDFVQDAAVDKSGTDVSMEAAPFLPSKDQLKAKLAASAAAIPDNIAL